MIMNKGIHDIIRPQWIFDSIASGELVPMSRKYFFHATAERMESGEYNNLDLDVERRSPGEEVAAEIASPPGLVDSKVSEVDSEMQDWLQIKPEANASENDHDDADSATDPDSDNEDNWFNVEPPQSGGGELSGMEVILGVSFQRTAFMFRLLFARSMSVTTSTSV
jgi:DNA ligase-4